MTLQKMKIMQYSLPARPLYFTEISHLKKIFLHNAERSESVDFQLCSTHEYYNLTRWHLK